jgi:hypothetical protein
LTVEEGQPASCTENYFCVLRNYINAHVRDLTHPTEKLSSVTSATDDRNVYIATTLLPPHPVSFKHDQKHFKPSKKLQICISSSNQLVSSPFYSESSRKHHDTKKKKRLVHLIGLFVHFSQKKICVLDC